MLPCGGARRLAAGMGGSADRLRTLLPQVEISPAREESLGKRLMAIAQEDGGFERAGDRCGCVPIGGMRRRLW